MARDVLDTPGVGGGGDPGEIRERIYEQVWSMRARAVGWEHVREPGTRIRPRRFLDTAPCQGGHDLPWNKACGILPVPVHGRYLMYFGEGSIYRARTRTRTGRRANVTLVEGLVHCMDTWFAHSRTERPDARRGDVQGRGALLRSGR